MIAQEKWNIACGAFLRCGQRCELSPRRTKIFAGYLLCCKRTACDIGKRFLIIPRISGVAGSPPSPLSQTFRKITRGAPEQNLRKTSFSEENGNESNQTSCGAVDFRSVVFGAGKCRERTGAGTDGA